MIKYLSWIDIIGGKMNNKIWIYIILIILILVALVSIFISNSNKKIKEISFNDITQDVLIESGERGYYFINTDEGWQNLLKKQNLMLNTSKMFISSQNTSSVDVLPAIDFNNNSVIAVFMGTRNTGGFEINVKKIIETKDNITVTVNEIEPDKNCNVIQVITHPYQIVKIQKITKNVDFKTINIIKKCD